MGHHGLFRLWKGQINKKCIYAWLQNLSTRCPCHVIAINNIKIRVPTKTNRKNELRRVWRYQRGNQNPFIEEQTTQWPTEKVQKDKQRSKTKDRVTRIPLKTGGELKCSGRVSSSCSTSDTRRVNLVTNPVISREWGNDREVFTISGTYPWSFVKQIFHNGQPSHGGDHKPFEVMTSIKLRIIGKQ